MRRKIAHVDSAFLLTSLVDSIGDDATTTPFPDCLTRQSLGQLQATLDHRACLGSRFEYVSIDSQPPRSFDISFAVIEEQRATRFATQRSQAREIDAFIRLGAAVLA